MSDHCVCTCGRPGCASRRKDLGGVERQRRFRAHRRGDHQLCTPEHCPLAPRAAESCPERLWVNTEGSDITSCGKPVAPGAAYCRTHELARLRLAARP